MDIYSVRQMAVYHGYDAQNDAHTFVLVNPSTTFQMHWLQAQKSDPQGMGWMDFHVAVAYAMSCRWREYVNHLEDKFDKTVTTPGRPHTPYTSSNHYNSTTNHSPVRATTTTSPSRTSRTCKFSKTKSCTSSTCSG